MFLNDNNSVYLYTKTYRFFHYSNDTSDAIWAPLPTAM